MTIDITPVLDEDNLTMTVTDNIDTSEEVSIMINGLIALTNEDFEDITDNVITLKEDFNIYWDYDSIQIMYTSL
jgi:hypothetical protein